jgi:hypothetical protein
MHVEQARQSSSAYHGERYLPRTQLSDRLRKDGFQAPRTATTVAPLSLEADDLQACSAYDALMLLVGQGYDERAVHD